MKSLVVADRRLVWQVVTLLLLSAMPISMIAWNGVEAVSGILSKLDSTGQSSLRTSIDGGAEYLRKESFAPVKRTRSQAKATVSSRASTVTAPTQANNLQMEFGIFDPHGEFANDALLRLRHVYVSWAAFDRDRLAEQLSSLEAAGYRVMLTIEPWPQRNLRAPLFDAVLAGYYDTTITQLAEMLDHLSGPVYLSWGHEMDQDLTTRYPWSGQDPARFVAAYRYVVNHFRQHSQVEIRWVWAGVLKQGSLRYWPGEDYVDLIGMPVYSFPIWDQQQYGYIRDFQRTFEEKRAIVAELEKPLIITELGVSGSPDFEAFWLHQAFHKLRHYPDLKAVVFFYSRDVEGAWGNQLPTPDWRVHPDAIRGLVVWYHEQSSQANEPAERPDTPAGNVK